MSPIPLGPVGPEMMCTVCLCRLNNHEQWKGDKLVSITWQHTGLMPEGIADHEPVPTPVDPDALAPVSYCDFCTCRDPEWSYPCSPFQIDVAERPNAAGGTDSLGWGSGDNLWAACSDCHADIEAGRWDSIEKRSISHSAVPKLLRNAMKGPIRVLHRQFRLNRLGPPFRVRGSES